MQKYLSSLFTGITLVILGFCLSTPTFGQETPEFRERAAAETALNTARTNYTLAKSDLNDAIGFYNDLVANWNSSISSVPGNILSLVAVRNGIDSSAALALGGLVSTHLPANEKAQPRAAG